MAFKSSFKILAATGLILGLSPLPSQGGSDLKALSLNVAQTYVIPAYEKAAKSSRAQADLWVHFCQDQKGTKDALKTQFHTVNDDWQQVQHLVFGPITSLLRRDRLYHWPERRNAVNRALTKLKAAKDFNLLKAENFRSASIALQGLPALERVLFDPSFDLNDPFACALGQAISANTATILEGTVKDWKTGEYGVIPYLKEGKSHPLYFENLEEISNRLFTQFLTGFQMITDQKLDLPLGKSIDHAKPKRAEFWRSQRSMRHIVESTKGLRLMGQSLALVLTDEDQLTVQTHLESLVEKAQVLPKDLGQAVSDPSERQKLEAFKSDAKSIRADLITIFTEKAGLSVGFNSLDGD